MQSIEVEILSAVYREIFGDLKFLPLIAATVFKIWNALVIKKYFCFLPQTIQDLPTPDA